MFNLPNEGLKTPCRQQAPQVLTFLQAAGFIGVED
jgi:hypothetical protein